MSRKMIYVVARRRSCTMAATLAPYVICLANHAGEQSPFHEEIASLRQAQDRRRGERPPRNDILCKINIVSNSNYQVFLCCAWR